MELKNIVIGTGTGLAVNSLVEKGMSDFWLKKGKELGAQGKLRYDQLMKEGKTEDEAILIIEKEFPLWKKLGSRRVNGFLSIGIGYSTFLVAKNQNIKVAATGVIFLGALKVLFPSKMEAVEFFYNE